MSDWSGDGGSRSYTPRPPRRTRRGPGSTLLAWIIAIILLMSMCSTGHGQELSHDDLCVVSPIAQQYLAALWLPDYQGLPDMDVDNDYLADVPDDCKAIVHLTGFAVALGYEQQLQPVHWPGR